MRISRLIFFTALFCAALSASAQLNFAGPTVKVESFTEFDGALPDSTMRVLFRFQLDGAWHVNSHTPIEEFLIPTELSLDGVEAIEIAGIVYPEHKELKLEFSETPLAVYEHDFFIGASLKLGAGLALGEHTVTGKLHYQACNDMQCAPPKNLDLAIKFNVLAANATQTPQHADLFSKLDWGKVPAAVMDGEAESSAENPAIDKTPTGDWKELANNFEVAGRESYISTEEFLAFIDAAEKGIPQEENDLSEQNIWMLIFLLLIGGFGLNLTPCVLPLIPINIAIIGAGAQASSRKHGFAIGAAYGLGIALVYGALGLAVVLGLSTAFGSINSTIWFNLGISALFIVLALAMFDYIIIDFTKHHSKFGVRDNEDGSFIIAFVMGAVSALLAGACVAPVLISVLLYAQELYASGVTIGLALPFLLGVGMALPWPFAGAGLSFLPKPGMWMTRVKHIFGVFILGFAAYYAYVAYEIYNNTHVDPKAVEKSVAMANEAGWKTSLDVGLQKALEENKPVLIDFWATWCKNCLIMNSTVLKDPAVLDKLEGYVKIKYQAEDFSASPTKEIMEHYEVLGLPTYIILHKK